MGDCLFRPSAPPYLRSSAAGTSGALFAIVCNTDTHPNKTDAGAWATPNAFQPKIQWAEK